MCSAVPSGPPKSQNIPKKGYPHRDLSTALPRISCMSGWRWQTSCAFPQRKGAHLALSSAAWQEIRVRFGRDDKGEGGASGESGGWTEAIFVFVNGRKATHSRW